MNESTSFHSVRSLVRYVDEDRSVIEAAIVLSHIEWLEHQPVEIHFSLTGPKGRQFSHQCPLELVGDEAMVRFEIDHPHRWWPAGMGEQDLYELALTLLAGDQSMDRWTTTLGMTSVRTLSDSDETSLLVNGRKFDIDEVITIGRDDEDSLLPVAGDTLLLVQDHFGPDRLYNAADRAGILLVQSIPTTPHRVSKVRVRREIDRLSSHPSLAGWHVGASKAADRVVQRVHALDPTRKVFRRLPRQS